MPFKPLPGTTGPNPEIRFRLPPDMRERLERAAQADGNVVGSIIRQAIARELERHPALASRPTAGPARRPSR